MAEMHILCLDTMASCNQMLVSAGIFNVSGFRTRYYAESDYLFAAIQIAKMTEGAPALRGLLQSAMHALRASKCNALSAAQQQASAWLAA